MRYDKHRILVVTAVSVEKDAVLRGLRGNQNFEVVAAGVGPVSAAAYTAKALATAEYRLVISAGIAGGFSGKAELGSLVVSDKIVGADQGVETLQGFSSLEELGFGACCIQVDEGLVKQVTSGLRAAELPVVTGPIITVATATGKTASAEEMARRVPGAAAEGMEGYGVAVAANIYGLPVIEIRAVSNKVGPRDREAWRIKEALEVLEKAFSVFAEVF